MLYRLSCEEIEFDSSNRVFSCGFILLIDIWFTPVELRKIDCDYHQALLKYTSSLYRESPNSGNETESESDCDEDLILSVGTPSSVSLRSYVSKTFEFSSQTLGLLSISWKSPFGYRLGLFGVEENRICLREVFSSRDFESVEELSFYASGWRKWCRNFCSWVHVKFVWETLSLSLFEF